MPTAPLISIVLPVYNGQKYLQAAIDSCLRQSCSDFELLIADDGSTDNSWSIIEKAASLDKRIKAWKNKENLGLFRNYNFCMEQATGKYIKPFAQDDLLAPECLERLSSLLEQDASLRLVTSARRIIDDSGAEIGIASEFPNDTTLSALDLISVCMTDCKNKVGEPCTVLFRNVHKGSGFDTSFKLYGDLEYWFRLVDSGSFHYCNDCLSSFRRHQHSESFRTLEDLSVIADVLILCVRYRQYIPGNRCTDSKLETEHLLERIKTWVYLAKQKWSMDFKYEIVPTVFKTTNENAQKSLSWIDDNILIRDMLQMSLQALAAAGVQTLGSESERVAFTAEKNNWLAEKEWYEQQLREGHIKSIALDEATKDLISLQNSSSWRLTSPLRRFFSKFRKPSQTAVLQDKIEESLRFFNERKFGDDFSATIIFDPALYIEQANQSGSADAEDYPLKHYLEHGEEMGWRPHLLFDPVFYKKQLGDDRVERSLLEHYLTTGFRNRLSPHPLFSECFYRSEISGLSEHVPSLVHYLSGGWKESVKPHPLFDTHYYLAHSKDVAAAGVEPLGHYLRSGEREKRRANEFFDVQFYEQRHGPFEAFHTALADFALHETSASRKPNRWFDRSFYLSRNPDVESYKFGPFSHYCHAGAKEGRICYPPGTLVGDPYEPRKAQALASPPFVPSASHWQRLLDQHQAASETVTRADFTHTVVVPVYRNFDLTMACLYSVLTAKTTVKFQALVVNDASPEPRLCEELKKLSNDGLFKLIVNVENLGFVGTVNRAFANCPEGDIVLLNSDAIVYDHWLDRLEAAAQTNDADSKIGTVTPFSNNATICSYPLFAQDNNEKLEIDYAELDQLFARKNAGLTVQIPTAVGFCMLIKRACLQEIGRFDEAAFGKGYGEENDFCLRAAKLGWRHVIAGDTFVRHLGSASFGADKGKHLEQGQAVLNARYPYYEKLVSDFAKSDPLKPLRENVDFARAMPERFKSSFLLFGHREGGGVERHIRELAKRLEDEGIRAIIIRPGSIDPAHCEVLTLDTGLLPNITFELNGNWQILERQLAALKVSHIHIHHAAAYGGALLSFVQQTKEHTQIQCDFTVHDYTPVCPRTTFVDGSGIYCGEPDEVACQTCVDENGSNFGRVDVSMWRQQSQQLLSLMRRVIVPNADVLERYKKRFRHLNLLLRPHFENMAPQLAPFADKKPDTDLRIAVIGSLNAHKGHQIVLACAQDALERALPLHFVIVGYSFDESILSRLPNVTITGPYQDENVGEVIAKQNCHASFFASIWPETYSYTFSNAMAANLYPFAFDLGAIADRIKNLAWGTLLSAEWMTKASLINDTFLSTSRKPLTELSTTQYEDFLLDYYEFSTDFKAVDWRMKYLSLRS
ncbi:MAG: glycosyltransferase [Candidatus Obscuribacterales bacterium]|nr:glycosyltransferase [Candidatus Obscuribacterales bacterium]